MLSLSLLLKSFYLPHTYHMVVAEKPPARTLVVNLGRHLAQPIVPQDLELTSGDTRTEGSWAMMSPHKLSARTRWNSWPRDMCTEFEMCSTWSQFDLHAALTMEASAAAINLRAASRDVNPSLGEIGVGKAQLEGLNLLHRLVSPGLVLEEE
ncbi:hypothetical protein HPB47_017723 [Ixodes persulcatus]|uniref:Uncharacterized protein n=1 Tax=Ixodes persulcatus TaxID=34615 RepID=A0AC60R343_IXOPE|nr:hypothetical protein HPB47_017723 [Ixodes persulcatus]